MNDKAAESPKFKQTRGHCPVCGPNKIADMVAEHTEHYPAEDDSGVWGNTTGSVLRCGGCKTLYFQESYIFSEDYDYVDTPEGPRPDFNERVTFYPAPAKRSRPEWMSQTIDHDLERLLDEMYHALDVDAVVLASIGARTVFDRASELLKIDPAITFQEKLTQLQAGGHIGSAERDHLNILTDAGSAAAHRGWKPTPPQLSTIMNILETFIYRTFVIAIEAKKLKGQIPARKKRQKP